MGQTDGSLPRQVLLSLTLWVMVQSQTSVGSQALQGPESKSRKVFFLPISLVVGL